MATIRVNGARREVQAPGDTPLLYVLRNEIGLAERARSWVAGSRNAESVRYWSKERDPPRVPFRLSDSSRDKR